MTDRLYPIQAFVHASELAGLGDASTIAPEPSSTDLAIQTASQAAILVPVLWLSGRTFQIKNLTGWRLVGIAMSASSALTMGLLLINYFRKR